MVLERLDDVEKLLLAATPFTLVPAAHPIILQARLTSPTALLSGILLGGILMLIGTLALFLRGRRASVAAAAGVTLALALGVVTEGHEALFWSPPLLARILQWLMVVAPISWMVALRMDVLSRGVGLIASGIYTGVETLPWLSSRPLLHVHSLLVAVSVGASLAVVWTLASALVGPGHLPLTPSGATYVGRLWQRLRDQWGRVVLIWWVGLLIVFAWMAGLGFFGVMLAILSVPLLVGGAIWVPLIDLYRQRSMTQAGRLVIGALLVGVGFLVPFPCLERFYGLSNAHSAFGTTYLWQIGVFGPDWTNAGLDSGSQMICHPLVNVLGVAWLLGLFVVILDPSMPREPEEE